MSSSESRFEMARDWIRFNANFEVVGGYLVRANLIIIRQFYETDGFLSHLSAMLIRKLD